MADASERIPVAVDDSDASERAVRHVGRIARGAMQSCSLAASRQSAATSTPVGAARASIVVGRGAMGSLRELFHDHPGDDLVKRARGRAVWVVG